MDGSGDEEAAATVGPASSSAAMRIEDVRLELGRALGAARHDMSRAVERPERQGAQNAATEPHDVRTARACTIATAARGQV